MEKKGKQGVDLSTLWYLGIPQNQRSQIWYDLLGAKITEENVKNKIKDEEFFNPNLTTYENIKLLSVKWYNIAFEQIDEDMKIIQLLNNPAKDYKGSIKTILKWFIIWQNIIESRMWYSINFWYIIQRLLSIFISEEKAFWMFVSILIKMKDKLGIENSVMTNRKGMFRIITACLLSQTKHTMPEIFDKFIRIGFSIDFYFYDKMSSLFANWFPSVTLLRLWDLMFYEFSLPISEVESKGLGYIVSTCLYLLNVNREQIFLSTTEEELAWALNNASSVKFDTEEIIADIFKRNSRNFDIGNWFNRKLSGLNRVYSDAASYLDNARNALEEDYDLIFEKTIRENKAVWNLLNSAEENAQLNFQDWDDTTNKWSLSKFKTIFGQKPSDQYEKSNIGGRGGDLEFSIIHLFIYNWFDTENESGYEIGKQIIYLRFYFL